MVLSKNFSRAAAFAAAFAAAVLISKTSNSAGGAGQTPPHPLPTNVKGVVALFGKPEDEAANWLSKGDPTKPASWPIVDGAMQVGGGDIMTKEKFTDYQLHLEFKIPLMPDAKGQARGNSGVFMQSRYEVQVLDSFGIGDPGTGDCGAVYNQSAPLVNATKPPKEWQTYDISFRAPRFDGDKMTDKGHVTVFLNGICVQNNTEIEKPTWGGGIGKQNEPGPIVLQDHGNKVEYRNVWIMPLPLKGAAHY